MYKQEKIKPYEGQGDKGKLVEEMFDNIAPTYDTLNHRLSWDIDKGWRKKAINSFQKEDCLNLSFPDNTFDAVTAAFGIRNFQSLDQGLREMHRVLKKGGHLSIVELTSPVRFPMKQLFRIYSHTVLPIYGKLISKDQSAYSYLTATIEAFPQGETMMEVLRKAGFAKTEFKRLTFGICTMYFATK